MTARRRRWLRLAVPFAVLALFWGTTAVTHALEQPDLGDAGTLSPTGTGPDGSSRLAAELTQRGVTVDRVTSSAAAVSAAAGTDATLLVPTPDFLAPGLLPKLSRVDGEHRVVVVKPGARARTVLGLPFELVGERWATGVASPGCAEDVAVAAGPARMRRAAYVSDETGPAPRCYGGALVNGEVNGVELTLVGATEPFRNAYADETGNLALAAGLLDDHSRVIWLDVHATEALPISTPKPKPPAGGQPPDYERPDRDRAETGFPVIDAFPVKLWVILLLLAAGGVLLAFARARRLGGPVAEPLPVVIPAAESVTGRGRLYQRVHARGVTIDALRASAIRRLQRGLFRFGPPPPPEALVAQVAQQLGRPAEEVQLILYGPAPGDDAALVAAAHQLDGLVAAVIANPQRTNPQQTEGGPA